MVLAGHSGDGNFLAPEKPAALKISFKMVMKIQNLHHINVHKRSTYVLSFQIAQKGEKHVPQQNLITHTLITSERQAQHQKHHDY